MIHHNKHTTKCVHFLWSNAHWNRDQLKISAQTFWWISTDDNSSDLESWLVCTVARDDPLQVEARPQAPASGRRGAATWPPAPDPLPLSWSWPATTRLCSSCGSIWWAGRHRKWLHRWCGKMRLWRVCCRRQGRSCWCSWRRRSRLLYWRG